MPRRATDTADRILDLAEILVQTQGFNGFSYADIAAKLRIRNASIHYHFPSKAQLGARLIRRYHGNFREALDAIDHTSGDARRKLKLYAQLYANVLKDRNRMCLCGMLASDHHTLPKPVRDGVKDFFDDNEEWLAKVLEEGREAGELRFEGSPSVHARVLLSSLEGAMLVARSYGEVSRFESVVQRLLADLDAKA